MGHRIIKDLLLRACWHDVQHYDWPLPMDVLLAERYGAQQMVRVLPNGTRLNEKGLLVCLGNRCPSAVQSGGFQYCSMWNACWGLPVRADGEPEVESDA